VKRGGAWGGFWYFAEAMLIEVMLRVEVRPEGSFSGVK